MYQQILGSDLANANITHAYIWVLPKSGTISLKIFFQVYWQLLKKQTANAESTDLRGLIYTAPDRHKFNKAAFLIEHRECPGIEDLASDPQHLMKWQALSYSTSIPWNSNYKIPDNTNFRFVFVYRNFLDQVISYYKYTKRYSADSEPPHYGKITPENLEEFIRDQQAIESYIKMFYSFHVVRQAVPDLILMVPYEELILNRATALRRIMRHLDIPYDEAIFQTALQLTSIESLKAFEASFNGTLMTRTNDSGIRHIHNGGIGVWQDVMTIDMVKGIEAKFNEFGLSLKMFYLADKLKPEFAFLQEEQEEEKRTTIKLRPPGFALAH